jgi:hypothetical protein
MKFDGGGGHEEGAAPANKTLETRVGRHSTAASFVSSRGLPAGENDSLRVSQRSAANERGAANLALARIISRVRMN